MTVLIVTEPGVDGVFRYVEALCRFLTGQAVRVHLAYSDHRGSEALARLVDSVHQHGGRTLNLRVDGRPSPRADWRALQALRDLVREVGPDIVHSHSSKAGVLARALPLFGIRLPQVYHPHAYAGMRAQSIATRLLYDGIEAALGRRSMTINCSDDEHTYARRRLRLPAARTLCVPNGVDTCAFTPPTAAEKIALRRRFGLPLHAKILGAVGRAAPQKDPLTLYRAFARALAIEPGLVLFHLGTGELDGELDRFVHERRLHASMVRRAYLDHPVGFYRALDGFASSSRYEGMALSVLEAIACDLPLILSDAPGNRSLFKLPFNQLWSAPIGDVPAFARAIVRWARAGRAGWTRRPSNHRRLALEHFDSRQGLGRVLALYQTLVTSPHAGVRLRHAVRSLNFPANPRFTARRSDPLTGER